MKILPKTEKQSLNGDFDEIYNDMLLERGKFAAWIWYWWQIFNSLPRIAANSLVWSFVMFKNYLKVSLRIIKRQKIYSFINIFGLAAGMACCILILLWVWFELSFDRFHENSGNIYRMIRESELNNRTYLDALTPPPLGPEMKEKCPEVKGFVRYRKFVGTVLLAKEDNRFYESDGAYTDPSFFEVFTIPFIKGNPETALRDKYSVVLTEEMAGKYFGDEDPIGKVLRFEGFLNLTVTGIIKNIPKNSHLRISFLVPIKISEDWGGRLNEWDTYPNYTYIQLKKGASYRDLEIDINNYIKTVFPERNDKFIFQPLNKIHLHSYFARDDYAVLGNVNLIYIFSAIALFILIIACINFINLTTARSLLRSREICIRKVVGCKRTGLISQFFVESVFMTFAAFILALLIARLLLPVFNNIARTQLSFLVFDIQFILFLTGIFIIAGLFSGIYPAVYLSSFKPINAIKKGYVNRKGIVSGLRRSLVVFQFSLSIILIIGTLVVYKQLRFIKGAQLRSGRKEVVVYVQGRGNMRQSYFTFKNELMRNPDIISVSSASNVINAVPASTRNVSWEGMDVEESIEWGFLFATYDYFKTLNLEIIEGRTFSKDFPSDAAEAFVINQEAAGLIGIENIIGKQVGMGDRTGRIIGIVEDYHFNSVHKKINPLVIQIRPEFCSFIFVRMKAESIYSAMPHIEKTWNKFVPDFPFSYRFLDETVNLMYETEIRMSKIFIAFTVLAVLIASLGLFGLASFMTEQRIREIGIRKVLGASVPGIVLMLSKEFTRWIFLANVIAWPAAFYLMSRWLQNFAYRTELNPELFFAAGTAALIISLITVSFLSIKAAFSNPVDSLRSE